MKIDPQDYLRLVENAHTLAFVDIETTGLKADYNSVLVVSIKPFGQAPRSFYIRQPGNDQRVVRETKEALEQFDCWVTFYGKSFDIPFLNTRLLKWNVHPIEKRHHVDLYYTCKANLLTGRRSQAHMLRFLDTPEQKMDMSPDEWNEVLRNPEKAIKKMVQRCESDVRGLEGLYRQVKHIIKEIKQ